MDFDDIIVETRDHICTVTMNRPEKLNAFRTQTNFEMKDALDAIDKDGDIHCVILTGAGRSFSSGHDTSEPQPDGEAWLSRHSPGRIHSEVCETLFRLRQPVVAAINGWCAGGALGMALCSDILIASEDAKFYVPQIAYGYPSMPTMGALLYKFVSVAWAKDIIIGRAKVDAKTAKEIGLVSRIVPSDKLMDEAWRTAQDIAEIPPDVMAMQREMMNRIWFNMGGPDGAFVSGRHTAIAGHSHPDWREREADWKTSQGRGRDRG